VSESTGPVGPSAPELPSAPAPQQGSAEPPQLPTTPPPAQTPHDIEIARLNSGLKTMRKQYESAQAELDKVKAASQSEQEQAIAKAKAEGEATYLDRWRTSALLNAAQARLALKGVKSIGLAAGALNLADITFDPVTGVVDQAALDARIDALLTEYPELVPGGRVPPAQMDGNQQRVTADALLNASTADKNALLRYALGR
jgi:hypothetical protein